jgi:hypothetical protein
LDRFPALRLILRFGRLGATIVAVILTAAAGFILWSSLGWFVCVVAPFVFALSYVLAKSYVEIVQIVTEMVH